MILYSTDNAGIFVLCNIFLRIVLYQSYCRRVFLATVLSHKRCSYTVCDGPEPSNVSPRYCIVYGLLSRCLKWFGWCTICCLSAIQCACEAGIEPSKVKSSYCVLCLLPGRLNLIWPVYNLRLISSTVIAKSILRWTTFFIILIRLKSWSVGVFLCTSLHTYEQRQLISSTQCSDFEDFS